jgi:Tol biopolymer transport system component
MALPVAVRADSCPPLRLSVEVAVVAMFLCVLAVPAAAQIRTTERASTTSTGLQPGTQPTIGSAISSDGRFVVFASFASTYVAGDTNNAIDVFVKDRQTNLIERVSVATPVGGVAAQGNGTSGVGNSSPLISGNGRIVAFESAATNLVAGDTNGLSDIFVHDRPTRTTRRVSLGTGGVQLNNVPFLCGLSTDGRFLTYRTNATNVLPGVSGFQVYRVNLQTNVTELVSRNTSNVAGNGPSIEGALSADGRHVAFMSAASNLDLDVADTNGAYDVYVRDMETGITTRASVNHDGSQTIVGPTPMVLASAPTISGDGRYVAFTTAAELRLIGDTNAFQDVFVRDRDSDRDGIMDELDEPDDEYQVRTFRISRDIDGADADGNTMDPSLSFDGRFIAFMSTASDLVSPPRPGGIRHLYLRDLDTDGNGILEELTGELTGAFTSLESVSTSGLMANNGTDSRPRITPNARFVVFGSNATNLDVTSPDTNGLLDIYVRDRQAIAVSVTVGAKPALSGDGRYLAFQSSEALVTGDDNGASDVFVRNLNTGGAVRISVNSNGGQGNGGSLAAAISRNGRFVVFESDASNFAVDDTNGVRDVFLRDRDADGDGVYDEPGGVSTVLISRSVGGAPGNGLSRAPAISADGRFIAFASEATNLIFDDTNGHRDIFLRDRQPPLGVAPVTRVNLSSAGAQTSNGPSDSPRVSDDGTYVVFESNATNLVAGDNNSVGDIFARDRVAGTTSRISILSNGGQSSEVSFSPAMSGNGERVVYTSSEAMVAGDGNDLPDVFGKPISGGTTGRDSVGTGGVEADGGSGQAAISADGTLVAFTTNAPNLAPELDTNGSDDIYVRDRTTNRVRLLSVPTGAIPFRASDASLSANGKTIAFAVTPLDSFVTAAARAGEITVGAADITEPSIVVQSIAPANLTLSPKRGSANAATVVQIMGTGISHATRVTFNGTAGANLRVEGDVVRVTAPPKPAGPVEVNIEIAGFQLSYVDTFTYDEIAAPTCTISAEAPPANLAQGGGETQVTVNTPADCSWVAGETVDWLQVADPGTGSGMGSFSVIAAANPNPAARTASVMVSGVEVSITQTGMGCESFTVDPLTRVRTLPRGAGEDLGVGINIGFGCPWTATSSETWLTVSSRSGPGIVRYTVTENTTSFERRATLTVQGIAISVVQAGTPPDINCAYGVTPPSVRVPLGVPSASFTVTPSNQACTWSAHSDVPWMTPSAGETGTGSGAVVFALQPNAGGTRRGTASVAGRTVTVEHVGQLGDAPFGFVDTPAEGVTNVSGAIPLTGWAIDDTGVTEVIICRHTVPADGGVGNHPRCLRQPGQPNEVYVASALFVRGARPDIQAGYPAMPNSDRAGWGVMLLTNYLPGANGTFTFTFRARDGVDVGSTFVPGNVYELGRRTISVNNATASKPFGTIDTPAQGDRVSGPNYVNFGWALTPLPKTIPTDGSTIAVVIDGVPVGAVNYNNFRSDISTLFPGFNNSNGAVGHRVIDTRVLSNGVHTIAWVVSDNTGANDGIGSRYFEVANGPGAIIAEGGARPHVVTGDLVVSATSVHLRRNLQARRERVPVDDRGTRHVLLRAMDIGHLELGGSTGTAYEGSTVNAGALEPLPIGSSFNADDGVFSWQLGPGFVGVYELYFVRIVDGRREGIPVRLVVRPHATADTATALTVDPLPSSIGPGTTLSGWAVNGAAHALREIFVYAYPTDGSEPFFVGETRLDPADASPKQSFGGQFARARFSLAVTNLPAGTYDVLVAGKSTVSSALDAATWVGPITVR